MNDIIQDFVTSMSGIDGDIIKSAIIPIYVTIIFTLLRGAKKHILWIAIILFVLIYAFNIYYYRIKNPDVLLHIFLCIILLAILLVIYRSINRAFNIGKVSKQVIKFTRAVGNCKDIKFFSGDLGFLCKVCSNKSKRCPQDNKEYKQLMNLKSNRIIKIIGYNPEYKKNEELMLTYGKLLHEFGDNIQFVFYDNENIKDFDIRGRLIHDINSAPRAIIYHKTEKERYIKNEYTANEKFCNFYHNLFNMFWDIGNTGENGQETQRILEKCREKYIEHREKQCIKNQKALDRKQLLILNR